MTLNQGEQSRQYRLPTARDYEPVYMAQARVTKLLEDWASGGKKGLCPVLNPNRSSPGSAGEAQKV